MRIFFDTNVLASAFATRGICADLFRETLVSQNLIVSDPLLKELRRILLKKFHMPKDFVDEAIAFLERDTFTSPPGELFLIKIEDKDDIVILSSALHGRANIFVTGDKELLNLKKTHGMEILSPRNFWDRLYGKSA